MRIITQTLFYILFLSLSFAEIKAHPSTKTIDDIASKIHKAIVFSQGAQVFRTATVDVPAGVSELRFVNISPSINKNSIQCKAPEGINILSLRHRIDVLNKEKKSTEIISTENEIEKLSGNLQKLQALSKVLDDEEALLKANMKVGGSQTGIDASELQEVAKIYRDRMKAIRLEKLDFSNQMIDINREIAELQLILLAWNASNQEKSFTEIMVKIDSEFGTRKTFELSYVIAQAAWVADYDVRVKNAQSPILLNYKAKVKQNSGEDWENVKLILSTGEPYRTGDSPKMEPWYLGFNQRQYSLNFEMNKNQFNKVGQYDPTIRSISGVVTDSNGEPLIGANIHISGSSLGTVTDFDGRYQLNIPANYKNIEISYIGFSSQILPIYSRQINVVLPDGMQLDEVVVMGYSSRSKMRQKRFQTKDDKEAIVPAISTVEKTTSVEFEIKEPYTIKKDGKAYTVRLDDYELKADYEYYCAPKLDPAVFLTANIHDADQYHLLSGNLNLFYEGTYLGKSYLDANQIKDTMSLSLGRDRNIVVKREKNMEFNKRKFFGTKRTDTRAWDIQIKNKKSIPIHLIIEDQYPISKEEQIQVDLLEYAGAMLDEESHILKWEMDLAAHEEAEIAFKYSVKYPKIKTVFLE